MKLNRSFCLVLVLLAAVLCVSMVQAAVAGEVTVQSLINPQSGTWTRDGLKALLDTPLVLFAVMLLASLTSGLKQVAAAKKAGSDMTFVEYWAHLPDTMATVIGNMLAFAALILTDQLNFAAALGIGYGVNSITDLLPGKRSGALAKSTPIDGT